MKLYQLKAINLALQERIQWYKEFNEITTFSDKDREILELVIPSSFCQQVIFQHKYNTMSRIYQDWERVVKNTIKHLTT